MKNYIGYISVIITVLGIIIGGTTRINNLEAKIAAAVEKADKVEIKVEKVNKDTIDTDKSLTEMKVEQKYAREKLDEVSDDLKTIIKELKKK